MTLIYHMNSLSYLSVSVKYIIPNILNPAPEKDKARVSSDEASGKVTFLIEGKATTVRLEWALPMSMEKWGQMREMIELSINSLRSLEVKG